MDEKELSMNSRDNYLACRAAWEVAANKIKRLVSMKTKKQKRDVVWSEFRGFVHGRLMTAVPDAWIDCLQHGQVSNNRFNGYYFDQIPFDKEIQLEIGGNKYCVMGQSAISCGIIRREKPNGDRVWQAEIESTAPRRPGYSTSGPTKTDWLYFSNSLDNKSVFVWGFNNQGYCYVHEFCVDTGQKKGRLAIKVLDEVYREPIKGKPRQ
jgi:hypothetical protein